jgi:hypothetical protein
MMKRMWATNGHEQPSATVQAQVVVMEDVDADDVRVFMAAHDDDAYVARLQAQHFAEVMANESGWEWEN